MKPNAENFRGRMLAACALVFGLVLIAYFPAITAGFIWNDSDYVTEPALRSLHGLVRIWFDVGATQQYYPLLHTAFWIEHRLWGDAPMGYHLVNILLHATSACLLYVILRRLLVERVVPNPLLGPGDRTSVLGTTRSTFFSAPWLAAVLFALHPVCVESVAWISEQKNTLSTVFYLLAGLTFLTWHGLPVSAVASAHGDCRGIAPHSAGRRRAWLYSRLRLGKPAHVPMRTTPTRSGSHIGWYFLSLGLFIMALLSKSVTATLPGAILVILWWRRGRLSWRRDVLPLVPWFAIGAAVGIFTAAVESRYIGAQGPEFSFSLIARFLVAGRALWFYLGKLFWPANLLFIYPRWNVNPSALWQYAFPLAAVALATLFWAMRKWSRGPLAALLIFAGTLFPTLGFFNIYIFIFSFVADHLLYLGSLGIIALVAAGFRFLPGRGAAKSILPIVVILAMGVLTWRQSRNYRSEQILYEAILRKNPDSWMAHNNLGLILFNRGRSAEAIGHFEEALRTRPTDAEAHNNLGIALAGAGRLPEAIAHYERALEIERSRPEVLNNLGIALFRSGRLSEAITRCQEAVRLKPDYFIAEDNLGAALAAAGRFREAVAHYERALQLHPDFPEAENHLGNALHSLGKIPEAGARYERALRLKPDFPEARNNLGNIRRETGDLPEAILQYQEALRLKPDYVESLLNLASAYAAVGRNAEAVDRYEEALRLQPDNAAAHDSLGLLFIPLGRAAQAVDQFTAATRLQPDNAEIRNNLGCVLAQLGRTSEAKSQFEAALRLKPDDAEVRANLARLNAIQQGSN